MYWNFQIQTTNTRYVKKYDEEIVWSELAKNKFKKKKKAVTPSKTKKLHTACVTVVFIIIDGIGTLPQLLEALLKEFEI